MNYEQLNAKLRELKLQKHEKERLKGSQQQQIDSLRTQKDTLSQSMKKEIDTAKLTGLKKHEEESTAKVEKNLEILNNKSVELKGKYDTALSKITFDRYKERYQEDVALSEQVNEILNKVKTTLDDLVGARFKSELYSQLQTATVNMDYESIEEASHRIAKLHKNLDMLNKGKGHNLTEMVDEVLKKMNPCKDESDEDAIRKGVLMYIGICGILVILVLNFLSPVLLLMLVVLGGMNIYKGYIAYRIVLETKILEDNKNLIDDLVSKRVNKDMENAKSKLDKKYSMNNDKIQQKINAYTDKLQDVLEKAKQSYKFDDNSIKTKYERTRSNYDHQIQDLKTAMTTTDMEVAKLSKVIQDVEKQIMQSVEGMISYYINPSPGEDYILEPKFLLDVVDSKPLFWDFPEKSCLILYDEENDVKDFTDLILTQLINRLHTSAFKIEVWDTDNVGTDYITYTKVGKRNFRLSVSKSEIKESQEETIEQMMLRRTKILASFSDIKEFNEEMMASDSLPASYMFNIIRSIDKETLTKTEVLNTVYNGPKVGIFTLAFLPHNTFIEMGDNGKELLNKFHKFYRISDGKIASKSRNLYARYFEKE